MKKFFFLALSAVCFGSLTAQEHNGKIGGEASASYTQVSVHYISDFVYLGRKDSLKMPYITPELGYYHKSGFFASGSLSYLNNSQGSRVDLYTIGLGFEKDFTKKLNAGAWFEKYFYNSGSTNVQSEVRAMTGIYGSYNFGPIETGINMWYGFASQGDIALGGFVKHRFISKDEKWELTPKAELNAATQNYYNDYFQNRSVATRRRLPNGTIVNLPAVKLDDATKFRFLETNFSAEIKYTTGKFEFNFTPAYILPMNAAVISIGNKKITEKLDNSFTAELGVSFSF